MADTLPAPDKIEATQPINTAESKTAPEGGKFASMMQEPNPVSPQNVTGPSPMAIQGQAASAPPTMTTIQGQMVSSSGSLGDIKNQLHTKNLTLKQSDKYALRNNLTNANQYIRGAATKLGVDTGPPVDLSAKKNPIAKFLDLVADGQQQLNSAAATVQNLNSTGQSVDPAALLLIQVKLQKAQQELDYSSLLLGKAIDMIKTMMNVQI